MTAAEREWQRTGCGMGRDSRGLLYGEDQGGMGQCGAFWRTCVAETGRLPADMARGPTTRMVCMEPIDSGRSTFH